MKYIQQFQQFEVFSKLKYSTSLRNSASAAQPFPMQIKFWLQEASLYTFKHYLIALPLNSFLSFWSFPEQLTAFFSNYSTSINIFKYKPNMLTKRFLNCKLYTALSRRLYLMQKSIAMYYILTAYHIYYIYTYYTIYIVTVVAVKLHLRLYPKVI